MSTVLANPMTSKQFDRIVRSQCMEDARRLAFLAGKVSDEAKQIESHYQADDCRCSHCSHLRESEFGISEELVEACIAVRLALRNLSELIQSDFCGRPDDFGFEMSIARIR